MARLILHGHDRAAVDVRCAVGVGRQVIQCIGRAHCPVERGRATARAVNQEIPRAQTIAV